MYNKFKDQQRYLTPGGGGRGGNLATRGTRQFETKQRSYDDRPTAGSYSASNKIKADIAARNKRFSPKPIPKKLRPNTVPNTRGTLKERYGPMRTRGAAGRALRRSLLLAAKDILSPNEAQKTEFPDDPRAAGWAYLRPAAPAGYVRWQNCLNPNLPTASFDLDHPTLCGSVSNAPTPPTGFAPGADIVEWGDNRPNFFSWGLNSRWTPGPDYDGSSEPRPGRTVNVRRYERTADAPGTFVPSPFPKNPPFPKWDADGRSTRARYVIRAVETVFPGERPTPTPGPVVRPSPRPRHRPGTTPRTGRVPWERDDPRTAPGPAGAPQPPSGVPQPTKVKTPLARPPDRVVGHLQLPGPRTEKKVGTRLPIGMLTAMKLFHTATELQDFVRAVFKAIWDNDKRAWRRTSGLDDKKPKTLWEMLAYIAENWGRVFTDPSTMADTMKNLVLNEVEDRVMGRLYGAAWETGVRPFREQYGSGAQDALDAAFNDPWGSSDGLPGGGNPTDLFPWNWN